MEPSKKMAAIADLLEAIAGRTTAIKNDMCVRPPIGCGRHITGFRNEMSEREYTISGLCQQCQDSIFNPKE